ncbi:MAG: dihydroorotase [Bacteroidales bacterium]|nr:dihydroorotase [Bacteroidales bacterium]
MADAIYISGGTLVGDGKLTAASLLVSDGTIEAVDDDASLKKRCAGRTVQYIDATGCYVLPGVIDSHVHFRDGGDGSNAAGSFESESRAAAAGGVTTVIDMPNTTPPTTSLEALQAKEEAAARHSLVNTRFMLGATKDNIDQLLKIPPDRYAAIKVFLGSSTGNLLLDDAKQLDRLFAEAGKVIVAHCEDEAIVRANLALMKAEFGGTAEEKASLHPKIRTREACYVSTYKAIERARKYNTRLHIAHLSTATELSLLSNQGVGEKRVTAEVTPNHLWFDDRDYEQYGNKIKCNPAIKTADDRVALWAGLYDGLIDTIATDHAPHPLEAKERRYFDAPSGIPSIQHSLPMMLDVVFSPTAAAANVVAEWLPLIVEKMCHNPALIFGLERRGFLREGYHADITIVRPNVENVVRREDLHYRCGWSPLEGMTFHSRVEKTIVGGKVVYDNLES